MERIILATFLSLALSACTVTDLNSHKVKQNLGIDSVYTISMNNVFSTAKVQEVEFCKLMREHNTKCHKATDNRFPGQSFDIQTLLPIIQEGSYSHLVLIRLNSQSNEEGVVPISGYNANGPTTNYLSYSTDINVHSVQVVSAQTGDIVYSAEVESNTSSGSSGWVEERYYSNVFEPVVEEVLAK